MPCFLKTRSTTRTMSLSSAGRIWGSISISGHLGAVAHVGGGDLRARGAGADDGDRLRQLGQRPGAPGVDDPVAELDPGDRERDRPGGEHDGPGLVGGSVDDHVGVGVERALARDQVDLVLVQSILTPPESVSETLARRSPSASQSSAAPLTLTPSSALCCA